MKVRSLILVVICLILVSAALPFMTACPTPPTETTTPPATTTPPTGTTTPPPTPKTLKIGVTAALTGFASVGEAPYPTGSEVAAEMINEQGGIVVDGQPYMLELITYDTQSTADGAKSAAEKLVYDDGVKFVTGSWMPFIIMSIQTVTEPNGVLFANSYNCAMPQELGPGTPFSFVTQGASLESAHGAQIYLTEAYPEAKNIVILICDDGSIPYLGAAAIQTAEQEGLTVLGDIVGWTQDTVDWAPVMTKALARNPDAIEFINGWPLAFGSMLKAAREQGFTGPVFWGFNNPVDVMAIAGPEASTNAFNCAGITPGAPDNNPMVEVVADGLRAKTGEEPFWYAFCAFNNIWVLAQAIEAAQSVDPDVVRATWDQMESMDSIFGPARMGGQETFGINHMLCTPLSIERMVDGTVEHVKWVEAYTP